MNNLRYKLRLAWQFELSGKPPFSFEFTVHKPRYGYWLTPFEIYEDSRIWSGLTLLGGTPVGLKLQSIGTLLRPRVIINVFHAGALKNEEQKEILQLVLECLRIEEDISEFYALAEQLPILKQAKQDLYGMRDTHFPDLFNGIILAVTLQMTTWQRSLEMMNSLYLTYGERIEFDGREVILAPSLATIAKANSVELKERCKLGYRANFLQAIARRIEEGFPSLQELAKSSPDEAKKELMKLKGIGEYSADIVTPYPSFPVDTWSVKIFSKAFGIELKEKPTKFIPIIKEHARDKFRKWQGYVYAYILHDLENLSKTFDLGF